VSLTTTQPALGGHPFEQPRYLLVARQLAATVSNGQLRPGDRLPGERELSRIFDVSRVTVRRALDELRRRSLIEPLGARGWFVTRRIVGEPNVLVSFTEMALARSLRPSSKVLVSRLRRPTREEAHTLAAPPGERLFELERVRSLSGLPVALEHSRLAAWLAPALTTADFTHESLYTLLRRAGVRPTSADYELQAVAADESTAALLEVSGGFPTQTIHATTFDQRGRPVELSVNQVRGDHYRFSARLFAPASPDIWPPGAKDS
jgi:GntR family transcriptional regulator